MSKCVDEIRSAGSEMRKAFEIDLMLRRYQKSLSGEIVLEDRVGKVWHLVSEMLSSSWRHLIKRSLDFMVALIGLMMALPVMAAIAIAIKLDSEGPVMYSQIRVGKDEEFFKMYKFRTMAQNAEKATGPVWAQRNDPRVTRLGRFLRAAHLDELPQLINVLKGEMSLVGPRPERPFFVSEFKKVIPDYERRLHAKPGITGLAQIKRSYDETLQDVKNKVRYDLFYIRKMCPFLDAKVLVLTVGSLVFRTGR